MQHKGFLRHTPSGMLLKKKGDEQLTALQTTFRRENLSLAGCSSAEPASVSVQQYKIQISKLYLQPVEIPSHFQTFHSFTFFQQNYSFSIITEICTLPMGYVPPQIVQNGCTIWYLSTIPGVG